MKYRIQERYVISQDKFCFFPQYKKWFMWWYFLDGYQTLEFFSTMEDAIEFINKIKNIEVNKRIVKYHEVE